MELVKVNVIAFGECMLEVTGGFGGPARLGYGGDTLNTALYLARLGAAPAYLTALGRDPYSVELRREWAKEGVRLDYVLEHPDRLPGLYAIRTGPDGERSFHYWRNESAARALFEIEGVDAALDAAAQCDLLHLSGITLSLFGPEHRARIVSLARSVRARGGRVSFDPNYRPRGWSGADAARTAIAELAPHVSIALTTLEDEAALHGESPEEVVAERWRLAGADEAIVKLGARGAYVSWARGDAHVEQGAVAARDTTGAGDSFNAAYLAARLSGSGALAAARSGNALAREVVMHPGAIIPREAMPREAMAEALS